MLYLSCGGDCTQGHVQSPHLTHTALTAFRECSSLQRAKRCICRWTWPVLSIWAVLRMLCAGQRLLWGDLQLLAPDCSETLLKPNSVAQPGTLLRAAPLAEAAELEAGSLHFKHPSEASELGQQGQCPQQPGGLSCLPRSSVRRDPTPQLSLDLPCTPIMIHTHNTFKNIKFKNISDSLHTYVAHFCLVLCKILVLIVCLCAFMDTCMCRCLQRPEGGV